MNCAQQTVENTVPPAILRFLMGAGVLILLSSSGAALDLNDTESLDYYPSSQLEFRVQPDGTIQPRGDIELSGNNIDTSGNPIILRDSTNGQDILRAQESGNLEIPNGNLFTQGAVQFDFGSGASYQMLEEGGILKLQTADGTDGIELDAGNDVSIPNGNLDVSGNNITNIDTLKFEEGTSIDGNVSINGTINTTGNLDLNDNNLLDANKVEANRIIDPEDGQININDNINLQNNQNIRSSGTNAITLDNNQNIEIPNGNLNLGQTDLNFGNNADLSPASSGSLRVRSTGGGNNVLFDIRDSGAGENRFLVREGGNVEVPTGNLDMKGNSVENVNSFSTQQINDIVPFSARGTGLNNNDARFVRIGGREVVFDNLRGLTLVVLSKSDYSVKSTQNYDTYGSSTASNNLASKLENMDNSEIGILTSYDAWENSVTSQLDQAFRNVGLYKAAAAPNDGSRRPYAAIFSGTGDSGGSRAQEILLDDSSDQPHAQLRGILIDGSFISKGTKQNNLVANQGNQVGIRALNSGEIEVPNGDIDVRENSIENVNSIQDNAGTDTITIDGNNNVQIPNGNLDVAGGNKGAVGSLEFNNDDNGNIESTGDGTLAIDNQGNNGIVVRSDGGSSEIARFRDSGSVIVPNGNVDINGNRIVDGGGNSDDTVFVGDGNNDNVRLETGGEDVDIPNGQLDVNSPANNGRTVDVGGGVNADGDLKTFSGNVASDQRMCIGDRCA